MAVLEYPANLTNKRWQKKKGLAGKTKSTGVGAALTDLEKAWAKGPYRAVDIDDLASDTLDPVVMDARLAGLQKQLQKFATSIEDELAAAADAIDAAIPIMQDTKGAKKAVAFLGTMADDLAAFTVAVADAPEDIALMVKDAYREKLHRSSSYKALVDARRTAEAKYKALVKQIKAVERVGTIPGIKDNFGTDGPHRSLTTYFKLWDQLVVKKMPQLAEKAGYGGSAMDTLFELPWLAAVGNEADSVASDAVRENAEDVGEERAVTQFCLEYSRSVIECQDFLKALLKAGKIVEDY